MLISKLDLLAMAEPNRYNRRVTGQFKNNKGRANSNINTLPVNSRAQPAINISPPTVAGPKTKKVNNRRPVLQNNTPAPLNQPLNDNEPYQSRNNIQNQVESPKEKRGLFQRMKESVSGIGKKLTRQAISPLEQEYSIDNTGMVPVDQYKQDILEAERNKQDELAEAKALGVAFDENMDPIYPPVELDDYLKGRYRIKAEEFKRLQQEQGFYFSDALDEEVLSRARASEGMFLLGVNINQFADLIKNVIQNQQLLDKDGNPVPLPAGRGDILTSGKSRQLTGEDYDVNFNNVVRKQMGYRLGPYRPVKPENVITKDTPFDNIIRESKHYTNASYERISPASLLNMVQILDEFSKTELQWLRVATAIEVIYKYMSNGVSRDQFFSNTFSISEESLLELEEFFRTDNLFMTLDELHEFRADLEYYRSPITKKEASQEARETKLANARKLLPGPR